MKQQGRTGSGWTCTLHEMEWIDADMRVDGWALNRRPVQWIAPKPKSPSDVRRAMDVITRWNRRTFCSKAGTLIIKVWSSSRSGGAWTEQGRYLR